MGLGEEMRRVFGGNSGNDELVGFYVLIPGLIKGNGLLEGLGLVLEGLLETRGL